MRCTMVSGIFLVFFMACRLCTASVNCTAEGAGRHPDPDDISCRNYTLCVYQSYAITYIGYDLTCPTTSLFNPEISKCSTNYVCNLNSGNTTDLSSVCIADGYIPDPDSLNCTSYISCYEENGTYSGLPIVCQDLTYFNPDTQTCELDYICPTSSSNTTGSNNQAEFTCKSKGRFEDTTHATCKGYFMCVLERNGTLAKYKYTCPNRSYFNPAIKVCTARYTCPR